jgi:hypothetical protein
MIGDFAKRAADNETKTGQKRPPLYHMTTNSYLQFIDKDHANQWLIKSRDVAPKQ